MMKITETTRFLRRSLLAGGLWLLLPLTVLAEEGSRYKMGWVPLPPIASDIGQDIDWMFHIIFWLTMSVMTGVFAVLIVFLWRYRERERGARRAIYSHGNNTIELIWTAIPAVILVFLAYGSEAYWSKAKKQRPVPEESIQYRIEGYQFAWDVFYPGRDGELGTEDDIKLPTLHMAKNKPVLITLTSRDVIHSLFLPDFRIKQDAMPGREVNVWFTPIVAGNYQIACAEFCGNGHTTMKTSVVVHESYEAYQKKIQEEIEFAEQYGVGAEDEEWF